MPGPPELPCACRSLHAARRPAMYSPLLSARQWCLRPGLQFFFSGGRRHTRSLRDWSSDVCSSDLAGLEAAHGAPVTTYATLLRALEARRRFFKTFGATATDHAVEDPWTARLPEAACEQIFARASRSEERRVGKEGGVWWSVLC